MSDHEEVVSNSGYDTPVPELDDHRHQTPSVQRYDNAVRVRDFEEAVIDEDAGDASPNAARARRGTVEAMDQRSISPPNSVKAFAQARRRERGPSFTENKGEQKGDEAEPHQLHRTLSVASRQSRRSQRSRPHTMIDNDASSISTNKSAEEDVCFPLQDERPDDNLHIDFEYLENFMREEAEESRSTRGKVFSDLRPQAASPATGPVPMATADGDIIDVPTYSLSDEKEDQDVKAAPATQQQHVDPNRFSFFSSAWESTIHAPDFADLVLPGEDVRGLFSFPKGETDGVWWLNVNNPTEAEVRAITRAFGIHPLTIEDITTQESREKIELFSSYYFACFRSFEVVQEDGEVEYEAFHLYVIVFREGTLSFSFAPNSHASNVRKRIAMLKDYVSLSSDWICYALIDDIVDSFAPVIHKIELDTEYIEDEVFIARSDDMHTFLKRIGSIRKNVMGLMRLLGGKADVLKGFTKRCNENYKVTPRMDIGLYLGDIQDHVVTMMNNLAHFEKMLSRSHSNYLAQLSIDSITQGTNTNRVLSKITFLASIIVPLNVITGLFGMNVHVPAQNGDDLTAFGSIVGGLVGFCLIALIVARRFRYI